MPLTIVHNATKKLSAKQQERSEVDRLKELILESDKPKNKSNDTKNNKTAKYR